MTTGAEQAQRRSATTQQAATGPAVPGRLVWLGTFAGITAVLLIRSGFLFTTRLYENGDTANDSILVLQAQHFTLLHGNYSREGFFHPGPAYIYVMAAGQWLFHDLTHLVPTPWNGQLIAMILLNSALIAAIAWVVHSWTSSVWPAVAVAALYLGFATLLGDSATVGSDHYDVLSSLWMPDVYVPTFAAFCVAASSVAAGRSAHLWLLAVTGCLAMHGHVEFLFQVPLITIAAAVLAFLPYRRHPLAAAGRFLRRRWRCWAPAVAVFALFALPVVIDVIAHFPGQFGKYLNYARSAQAGHHPPDVVFGYLMWYWGGGSTGRGIVIAVAAVALAVIAVLVAGAGPLRRFLLSALAVAAVATGGMLYYIARDIDEINQHYIGFFYWSVPLLVMLVAVTGLVTALSQKGSRAWSWAVGLVVAAGAVAAAGCVLLLPGLRADIYDNEPGLVQATNALAARAHGRPIVLGVDGAAAIDADGIVLQAERTGIRACLTGPYFWTFAVTSEFICTPTEVAGGAEYQLHSVAFRPAQGVPVIARLRYTVITPAAGQG